LVDVEWVRATYPSYSTTLTRGTNFTITLPADPVNHQMQLVEVLATAPIQVTSPGLLTYGAARVTLIPSGKTAFFGFRYSTQATNWFLLSTAVQA
jgi:hypothetical protein